MSAYGRLPVSMVRGEGAKLWDENGKSYLDALSGISVTALGHANPALSAALAEQAQRLMHTSNLYNIPEQQALGEALCRIAAMDKAFFCNSGAEANEAAIKIARLHGHHKKIDTPTIVVSTTAFHGLPPRVMKKYKMALALPCLGLLMCLLMMPRRLKSSPNLDTISSQ